MTDGRTLSRLARALDRRREAVFEELEAVVPEFLSDAELEAGIDALHVITTESSAEAEEEALMKLRQLARKVSGRKKPPPERKGAHPDYIAWQKAQQEEQKQRPTPASEPAAEPVPENVLPFVKPEPKVMTGREWISKKNRGPETVTRGLENIEW